MINIGVLASYNASGFLALQEAINKGLLQAKIKILISNNHNAKALENAKNQDLKALVINHKKYPNENIDNLIKEEFKKEGCEYILLSGYMKKLGSELTKNFKIINSHPALLPKFGGKGMYGTFVHKAVIEAKEKVSGCTIHYVNEEYDKGEIILQKSFYLKEDESYESLEEKVKDLEKKALLEVFIKLCNI